ncbi:MAG: D-TA family PLP-dependent enzyme [Proteobacteria bacterium]|nr:D-TA family PLP-dependent enzyme [Pseudomonadota bacterium]
MTPDWYRVSNVAEVPSPSLLVYPERVAENVRRMIAMAGGAARLRPHMKTHKMPDLIRLQLGMGVTKFKCATIAETEMVAGAGAPDALLAYQPVGPNVGRLLALAQKFPGTKFSAVADDADAIRALGAAFAAAGRSLDLYLDVDVGMHRTGVVPGAKAVELYRLIASTPGLRAAGLHVYDGHNHVTDLAQRTAQCEREWASVLTLRTDLQAAQLTVPNIVAGGTPTFPIHAKRADVECSPGTCVLWDFGYGEKLPDMDFLPAAILLTRVISKPGENRLCLDLGHKAVAAENPHPRVKFLNLPAAEAVMQSEEHLVVETAQAKEFAVGDVLYGVPRHICPTVALHSFVTTVRDGKADGRWQVTARERQLTV